MALKRASTYPFSDPINSKNYSAPQYLEQVVCIFSPLSMDTFGTVHPRGSGWAPQTPPRLELSRTPRMPERWPPIPEETRSASCLGSRSPVLRCCQSIKGRFYPALAPRPDAIHTRCLPFQIPQFLNRASILGHGYVPRTPCRQLLLLRQGARHHKRPCTPGRVARGRTERDAVPCFQSSESTTVLFQTAPRSPRMRSSPPSRIVGPKTVPGALSRISQTYMTGRNISGLGFSLRRRVSTSAVEEFWLNPLLTLPAFPRGEKPQYRTVENRLPLLKVRFCPLAHTAYLGRGKSRALPTNSINLCVNTGSRNFMGYAPIFACL